MPAHLSAELTPLFASGRKPRAYVASPLGFGEATRGYYGATYLPALAEFVEPIDPWSLTSPEEIAQAGAGSALRAVFATAAMRNSDAIAESELVIAHLDGQEVDSGTAAEVGYAAGRGLPVLGVRSDLRQSGEPEMAVNLQVEGFIEQSGGAIYAGLAELTEALRELRRAAA